MESRCADAHPTKPGLDFASPAASSRPMESDAKVAGLARLALALLTVALSCSTRPRATNGSSGTPPGGHRASGATEPPAPSRNLRDAESTDAPAVAASRNPDAGAVTAPLGAAGVACTIANETLVARLHGSAAVQIAATGNRAAVAWSEVWMPSPLDPDGHDGWGVRWAQIDGTAATNSNATEMLTGTASCTADPYAAAVATGGRATVISYGIVDQRESGGHDFRVQSSGRSMTVGHQPRALVAASAGPMTLAVTLGSESPCADMCACDRPDVPGRRGFRALRFGPGAATTFTLWTTPPLPANGASATPEPSAPALALRADGSGLLVFRVARSLRALRLGTDAHAVGEPFDIARAGGDVVTAEMGAPTVAFRGREAAIVWSERATPTDTFQLRSVQWDPDTGAPPAASVLTQGTSHAVAPAVSAWGDRLVLAWTEGDLSRSGVTRVGAARGPLAAAVAAAGIAATGVHDRDAEIAVAEGRAWIVWQRFPRRVPRGELRVAGLTCP